MMQPSTKRTVMSRATIMRELPSSYALSAADVFCAKGKKAKAHPGNKTLNALIQSHLTEYAEANTRLEKSYVVSKIMKHIKSNGGCFVRIVNDTYFDIGGRNAREKVGQALRDLLHDQYRSSTRAKACKRRIRIESSESLTTATLLASPDGTSPRMMKNKDGKPVTTASISSFPNLATSMATDAVESLISSSGNADSCSSSTDMTKAPVTPLTTPDEPLSLSIFDQLNACLEPEADFLLDDIDVDQPLPLAQSLVRDIDFARVNSSDKSSDDTATKTITPFAPNLASFPGAPKQQQQCQYQAPTMANWFNGGCPTMQNMMMARQFQQNAAPFLCNNGLYSACKSSSDSAKAFMMRNNILSSMPPQAMPVPLFGNAIMFQ